MPHFERLPPAEVRNLGLPERPPEGLSFRLVHVPLGRHVEARPGGLSVVVHHDGTHWVVTDDDQRRRHVLHDAPMGRPCSLCGRVTRPHEPEEYLPIRSRSDYRAVGLHRFLRGRTR